MMELIISEYVPNTFFWHIFNADLGHVSVSYSHRHVPSVLRSVAKLFCPDCRLVINANLTTSPRAMVDRNGITLVLEGDIGAMFRRRNRTYNILSANGQLRVGVSSFGERARSIIKWLLLRTDKATFPAFPTVQRCSASRSGLQGVSGGHGRTGGWSNSEIGGMNLK